MRCNVKARAGSGGRRGTACGSLASRCRTGRRPKTTSTAPSRPSCARRTSFPPVKVGVFVPIGTLNANAEFVRTLGPALEERGFESVWVAEHIVLFDEYESQYPYADNGRFPGGGD